jgi:succinate-semialdehyde dehydrogenase / glutarate-semialdehyde dehydrogenase
MTGRERSNLLRAWHSQIAENAEDLATLITWENGKPLADAKGEVTYSNSFFEWFAEEAPRLNGQTLLASTPERRVYTTREPVGVAGLLTPWNFPAAMLARKASAALAAGCSMVAKSPSETPLTMNALAELAHRAGIPPGVVNIVTSLKNTPAVGEALCTSPTVKKISFTGSTNVGKLLMKQSASTLKKLSFELGGNAPFIVFDDADLDAAVKGAIESKFRSSGQTCVCANRIYVQRGIYDDFAAALAEGVAKFHVGNGFEEGVTHGPLIHDRAINKAEQHVQDAVKKGATVVRGGERLTDLGTHFFAPTVLRDMTTSMQLAHEETFGPVAGLFPFDTEAEVVQLANDAEVGLAGYFFSRDVGRCWRVAETLDVGIVGVNTGLISDAATPFGGVKESGFGREGSALGLEEYTVVKAVHVGGIGELKG